MLKYCIETILLSAEGEVQEGQYDEWKRFAVIIYNDSLRQFVFSARRWNDLVSSYICQLRQGSSVMQVHSTKVCSLYFIWPPNRYVGRPEALLMNFLR